MDKQSLALLSGINSAIIKFRGIYSLWSGAHGIGYHEMLVLYTIREQGYCTQKQICESYLLPKQTIHNVITALRSAGMLAIDEAHSHGREKAFALTSDGEKWAAPLLTSLDEVEGRALHLMGADKLAMLTSLLLDYDIALTQAMDETR